MSGKEAENKMFSDAGDTPAERRICPISAYHSVQMDPHNALPRSCIMLYAEVGAQCDWPRLLGEHLCAKNRNKFRIFAEIACILAASYR